MYRHACVPWDLRDLAEEYLSTQRLVTKFMLEMLPAERAIISNMRWYWGNKSSCQQTLSVSSPTT